MSAHAPQRFTSAGWYEMDAGPARYWDGSGWVAQVPPVPSPEPESPVSESGGIVTIVVAAVLIAMIAVVGSRVLLHSSSTPVVASTPTTSTTDKPTQVSRGRAFTHDGYRVAADWRVGRDRLTNSLRLLHVRITNAGKVDRTALLSFRFYQGSTYAEVMCNGGELPAGATATMDCSSTAPFPSGATAIRVADSF